VPRPAVGVTVGCEVVELERKSLNMRSHLGGESVEDHDFDAKMRGTVVWVGPRYYRPAEIEAVLRNAAKVKEEVCWSSQMSFEEMMGEKETTDLRIAERDALLVC
jgi:GDPmannose 4,6-dehydratase